MVRTYQRVVKEINLIQEEKECNAWNGKWELDRCTKYFNDNQKPCLSGNQCQSGICVARINIKWVENQEGNLVTRRDELVPDENGLIWGKCRRTLFKYEADYGYRPRCQEAIIENGTVIKENLEECVIY